ncbi:hypothetical protein AB0M46_04620 [Dactylosporangium sp. NPDC051485]|uniref:hypothetical protein n=1 Tax=Dactylosporangium sp. NPDC051485 TaxID=3154846 RepID=UPI00342FCF52
MAVNVRAAVGGVAGELFGLERVRIAVHDATNLERDLESLGRALWAAHIRAVLDAAGHSAEPPPIGWRAAQYVAQRGYITATGRSEDGSVTISARGMRHWRITIAQDGRAATIEEAANALLREHQRQITVLKRAIWHPSSDRAPLRSGPLVPAVSAGRAGN